MSNTCEQRHITTSCSMLCYTFFFPIRKLTMLSSGKYRICHSNPTRARSPCIASHGRLLTSQHCHLPIFLLAFGLLVPVAWNNFKGHTATSWHLRGSSGSPPMMDPGNLQYITLGARGPIDLTKHTRYQRHIKLNAIIAGPLGHKRCPIFPCGSDLPFHRILHREDLQLHAMFLSNQLLKFITRSETTIAGLLKFLALQA